MSEARFKKIVMDRLYSEKLHKYADGRFVEETFSVGPFVVGLSYDGHKYKPPFSGGCTAMLRKDQAIVANLSLPGSFTLFDEVELARFLDMVENENDRGL